VIGKNEELFV